MIVHGEFFENDNANNVQLYFKKAIGKAGKPTRIYLDNEIHSSLGISPKERYLKDINQIKFVEKEQLEAAFLNRTTRKVTATATVSIFNTDYEVPQQFIRKKNRITL